MEEKTLIVGEKYDMKKVFHYFIIAGVIVGIILFIIWISDALKSKNRLAGYTYPLNWGIEDFVIDAQTMSLLSFAFRHYFDRSLIVIFIAAILIPIIIGYIWYWAWSKVELVVTNRRVYGAVAFGKRVDLPIDSISSVGTGLFKTITVGTSSGRIRFSMIKNQKEVHKVIGDLLVDRQHERSTQSMSTPAPQPTTSVNESTKSDVSELKELKELLDEGLITQEDYDAKKKQILGL